jgi:hypothetical protein
MTAMDAQTRADLLEIADDRANARATIIASQLPTGHWHEWIFHVEQGVEHSCTSLPSFQIN